MRNLKIQQKSSLIKTLMLFILIIMIGFAAKSQTAPPLKEDFKTQELQSFLKANKKVINIQNQAQSKMVAVIKDEGLTVDQFNAIARSQQQKDKTSKTNAKDLSSFNQATQKILTLQKKVKTELTQTVQTEGLDWNTYQEIMYAYQKSPKVKAKVNALLKSN